MDFVCKEGDGVTCISLYLFQSKNTIFSPYPSLFPFFMVPFGQPLALLIPKNVGPFFWGKPKRQKTRITPQNGASQHIPENA